MQLKNQVMKYYQEKRLRIFGKYHRAGPGPDDPRSMMRMHHSHVNEVRLQIQD